MVDGNELGFVTRLHSYLCRRVRMLRVLPRRCWSSRLRRRKGERKKSLACEDALEALRKSSLKELLDCDKENYDEEEMNREADENEQTSERRERLIRSLLKQKTLLEKTIEREEQRERIRARFGN